MLPGAAHGCRPSNTWSAWSYMTWASSGAAGLRPGGGGHRRRRGGREPREPPRRLVHRDRDRRVVVDGAHLVVRQVADGVDEGRPDPAGRGPQPLGPVGPP